MASCSRKSKPSTSSMKTRRTVSCPIFGVASEMSSAVLPTYYNVMKLGLWVRHEKKIGKKEPTFSEISKDVTRQVQDIWRKASIPTVSDDRILKVLPLYHAKILKILKPYKGRQKNEAYNAKLESFREEARTKLFDVAACKCDFVSCNCDKLRKVPLAERAFLQDQRTTRNMVMGGIDPEASKRSWSTKRKGMLKKQHERQNIATI